MTNFGCLKCEKHDGKQQEEIDKTMQELQNTMIEVEKEAARAVDKQQQIREGARKWKRRALAAEQKLRETEERCVELMQAKMQAGGGYLLALDKLDAKEKLLKETRDASNELAYELQRVKAHAYDLAFANEA